MYMGVYFILCSFDRWIEVATDCGIIFEIDTVKILNFFTIEEQVVLWKLYKNTTMGWTMGRDKSHRTTPMPRETTIRVRQKTVMVDFFLYGRFKSDRYI